MVLPRIIPCIVVATCGSLAIAQAFTNPTPINIGTSTAPGSLAASVYPSTINVAGVTNSIEYVTVTLNNFSHTWRDDLQILLVSPSGNGFVLMNGGGGSTDFSGNVTFAMDALNLTSTSPLLAGTFQPSALTTRPFASIPVAPPAGPYGSNLNTLNGQSANGAWQLFIADSFPSADGGSAAGGWSITFNGPRTPRPYSSAFTYQGVLKENDVPLEGIANLRFSLWNTLQGNDPGNRVVGPVSVNNVPVQNGVFTASVDLGDLSSLTPAGYFVQVEVSTPFNPAFVPLSPRQPLTSTPFAGRALVASSANALAEGAVLGPQIYIRRGGPSGVGLDGSSLRLDSDNSNYLAMTAPDAAESGVLFGRPAAGGTAGGSLIYNNSATPGGLQLRTDANATRMIIDSQGRVAIGSNPPVAKLDIQGTPGTDGIRFPDGTTQTSGVNVIRLSPVSLGAGTYAAVFSFGYFGTFQTTDAVVATPVGPFPSTIVVQPMIGSTGGLTIRCVNTAQTAWTLPAAATIEVRIMR
jgi:subtilisin-like proprotein convertase family protein